MQQEEQPHSGRSLDFFILNSLQSIHGKLGDLQGQVSSFQDEMVGRVTRLEDRERSPRAPVLSIGATILKAVPWAHVLALVPTFILAMYGLLSPAEIKAIVLKMAGVPIVR